MARRLTLAEAKAQVRAFGFSLKSTSPGEYVLTPSGEREGDRSYYTNDLEDAVGTARSTACTQHEDCAANLALGQACMARQQKGRAGGRKAPPVVPMGRHVFEKYAFILSGDVEGPVRVQPLDRGTYAPFKGPTTRLLETFNPAYSHRRGYTLSRPKAAAFFLAAKEGLDTAPKMSAALARAEARSKATNEAVLRLVADSGGRVEGDHAFIDTAYGRLRVHPSGPTFIATRFEDAEKAKPWTENVSGKWNFHGDDAPDVFKHRLSLLLRLRCAEHADCNENAALGRACLIDRARGRVGGRKPPKPRDPILQQAEAFGFAAGRERLLQGGRGNWQHGVDSLRLDAKDAWDRAYLAGYRRAGGPLASHPHGRFGPDAGIPTIRVRPPRRW